LIAGLTVLASTACTVQQVKDFYADRHISRGDRAMQREDLDRALAEFTAAISLNPELAAAYVKVGHVHRQRGENERAVGYYAEALRRDPADYESAFSLGEVYQALSQSVSDRVRRLEAAIRAYLHAVSVKPDSAPAYLNLGTCSFDLGRVDAAIDYYLRAAELAPTNSYAHYNLGTAYEKQERFYDAIRSYKTSLECDANQPRVHVQLGVIYLKQNRYVAAVTSFERAVQMDESLAVAHERLAYCRFRDKRFEDALTEFNRAIELDPKMSAAFRGRGVVEMTLFHRHTDRTEFRDRAIEDWHRSLELEPDQPRVRELVAKYAPVLE
jgi:superkiller protein 3